VRYFYNNFVNDELFKDHPQIILLSNILPDPVNAYLAGFRYQIVDEINGHKVRTLADVANAFPVYDDDKYGTVTLQQFAHSIGLTLYEGMWISRAYSLKYPAEIKENMYFAIETFAGHPGLQQTARLEENVLVSGKGPVVFTLMEHMEEAMKR